ncbi:MAG: hypothetical protein ACLUVI_10710 [Acutalibacteraceae bacterium]
MKEEKSKLLQALEAKVKELTCGGMCIAYSGDDGSTLLLKLAADMKARILAVTFRSPLAPVEEAQAAQERAKAFGAESHLLPVDLLRDPRIASNSPSRCFYCRRTQYEALSAFAVNRGIFCICDGTCADAGEAEQEDKLRALRELGVRSPLKECGVTRAQARALLRELGVAPGGYAFPLPCQTPSPLTRRWKKRSSSSLKMENGCCAACGWMAATSTCTVGSRASPHGGIRRLACWPQHRIV